MQRGDKDNKTTVVDLHKAGHNSSTIFKLLQLLKISKKYTYRTFDRFKNL